MPRLKSSTHFHCAHKTGYLVIVRPSIRSEGGWTWHRTLAGAIRSQLRHGGQIHRIISDDHTALVR